MEGFPDSVTVSSTSLAGHATLVGKDSLVFPPTTLMAASLAAATQLEHLMHLLHVAHKRAGVCARAMSWG